MCAAMLSDKVCVGLEHAPHTFDVCSRVLGQGGANLDFIRSETGAMVILKGGSGDKTNPLHIALNHARSDRLASARTLALNLIDSVRQEYQQWSAQQPPAPAPAPVMPALNIPPPTLVGAPGGAPSSVPPLVQQQGISMAPMPQVVQLVPQQQIFVGPDGTHYVKVTFAQTPTTGAAPAATMAIGQQNLAQQQAPPVQNYAPPMQTYAPPPQTYMQHPHQQHQAQTQPQVQVQILNGMAGGPSVCSAPTLTSQSAPQRMQQWDRGTINAHHALQHQIAMHATSTTANTVQSWVSAATPAVAVPAPVQVNTAAPPPVNVAPPANNSMWGAPAANQQPGQQPMQQQMQQTMQQPMQQQQTSNRPWGEPPNQPAQQPPSQQTTTLGGNIPWYKNSQNTASVVQQNNDGKPPRRFDQWAEGEDQNNSGTSVPIWAAGSGTPKNALPDLREEIMKNKDEKVEGENERRSPRRNRDRRMDNRGPRRDNRRDRRRETRRPYTDAEVYRRQFRSAGVLGEDRNADEENNAAPMNEEGDEEQPATEQASADGAQGLPPAEGEGAPPAQYPDRRDERPGSGQPRRSGPPEQANSQPGQPSKWDRSERPAQPYQPPAQYNVNNHYTQSAPPQYNQQQQPPANYNQSPYKQQGNTGGYQQPPQGHDGQPGYDKQAAGAPSSYNWANAQQSQQYDQKQAQWSQPQHPWNQRGGGAGQGAAYGQEAAGYGERPWGNRGGALPPPPPPPPQEPQSSNGNYWPSSY